jgi:hypothetical protein
MIKAGQASVFKEDAKSGSGELKNARVNVLIENDRIVLRITDAKLIQMIFAGHPDSATINTREIGSNFEVVKIAYRSN